MAKTKKKFKAPVQQSPKPVQSRPKKAKSEPLPRLFARITTLKASLTIAITGFAVFFTGLTNNFLGDDNLQIVNNPPVHSLSNILLFFQGGTFYVGNGLEPLAGAYFRPMMATAFSFIYTLFGPHPIYFHLFQLIICIGGAIVLYLLLRTWFRPALSLLLSLIFLVHPLNSQVVFALAAMQDALFFFFGILAVYLIIRFSSVRSMAMAALCLLLSLLSKEAGVYFVAITFLYLTWYHRQRLLTFAGIFALPFVLYLILKTNAVGLMIKNPGIAPIDKLDLADRLLNAPSAITFYLTKMIFPWKLASGYYWAYSEFSITHVLVPLIIDLLVLSALIYIGYLIRKKADKATLHRFIFFGIWVCIGFFTALHIVISDMTACETWIYFSMAGLMGLVGTIIEALGPTRQTAKNIILYTMAGLVLVLGTRTAVRGFDWKDDHTLGHQDVAASPENYIAFATEGDRLNAQGEYQEAIAAEKQSISIFPSGFAYSTLCSSYFKLDRGPEAQRACLAAIRVNKELTPQELTPQLYNNLALIYLKYDTPEHTQGFIADALQRFPHNSDLWLYLALAQYAGGNPSQAKESITKSLQYDRNNRNQGAYNAIMNGESLNLK